MPNLPNPSEVTRDVVDSALDIVGTPASVIRAVRDQAKQLNGQVSSAASGQGSIPDPIGIVMRIGNAAISELQSTVNNVKGRLDRLGR